MTVRFDDDPFTPSLGCGFNDWICYSQEGFARILGSACKAIGNFIADMFTNAFAGGGATSADWNVADSHFWFWAALTILIVLGVAAWQITTAVILQQPGRIVQVAAGMCAGIVLSVLALRYMPTLVSGFSGVTTQLTAGFHGKNGIGAAMLNLIGLGGGINGAAVVLNPGSPLQAVASTVTGGTDKIGPLLLVGFAMAVIAAAGLMLFVAMSLRTFGLIVGVAFAPLGLMFYGQPRMREMAEKWAQLMLGLLLAEPLAAGIILLAVNLAATTTSSNLGLLFVSSGATIFAAFSPLWAIGFVSFAAGDIRTAASNSQSFHRHAGNAGRSALRGLTRLPGRFAR